MENQSLKPIAILGAGSWGTALALYLARRGQTVHLWSVDPTEIGALLADGCNHRFMPGHVFPATIQPTTNLAEALKGVDDVLVVVPSVGFRNTLANVKSLATTPLRITCATKGLDAKTGALLSEVAEEVLGTSHSFAMLSGPSFAREVAAGLPSSVVIASKHPLAVRELSRRFDSPIFRIYPSDDVIGVEIGGIVKNVIAIATGISDGMEHGTNARCALMTLGLAEMIRLGTALGGKLETFIGLSGMGDLILTASDNQSRNRRLGLSIGKGLAVDQAEREIGQVVEGRKNAELVTALAKKHGVQMPICETVWQLLQGKIEAKAAVEKMFAGN